MLSRLNNAHLWGKQLFVFALIINAFLTLIMDVLRQGSITWLWFVPLVLSYALVTGLGMLVSLVVRRFDGHPRLWMLNLFFAGVLGAIKNGAVGLIADFLHLANDATFGYRLFGGAVMGISIVFFVALAIGARAEHRDAVSRLIELQSGLVNRKKRLEQTVIDENEKLVRSSNEVLIPKLRQIEQSLSLQDDLAATVLALKSTIENDLRPLTRQVEPANLEPIFDVRFDRQVTLGRVKFPTRINVKAVLRPWTTWIYNAVSLGILAFFFKGFVGSLLADLSVTGEVLLLLLVRGVLRNRLVSRTRAAVKIALIALFCSIPNAVMLGVILNGEVSLAVILLLVFVVSVGSAITGGYSVVLDSERARVETEIARENTALAHEIALYEQRIWVFRKSWQLLLHGTVQAALTAALTRLNMPAEDEVLRAAMVRQDLARAEVALQSKPVRELDLHRTISELTTTWRGVCDVSIKVSERAARALKRNFEVMFGVNEIMREAVSNAVRHAGATDVQIEIDRERDDLIDFVAKNGGKPIKADVTLGMGSQMLDELTVDWSLTQDERQGKTVLSATIPVSL